MRDKTESREMTDLYYALAATILLILITYFLSRRLKKTINVVLLTGLSESGKTALFSKIIFNKPKRSVTSLKENEATIKEFNLRLIDLPGADKLRDRYWEQYREKAKQVIFIIDSTTVELKLRDLCEYLYKLLSDKHIYKNSIQVTIACNKQDLEDAKKKDLIQLILEKELNAIKKTKTGQLGTTSNEEDDDCLTKQCPKEISLLQLNVNLIETSVYNPEQLVKLIL